MPTEQHRIRASRLPEIACGAKGLLPPGCLRHAPLADRGALEVPSVGGLARCRLLLLTYLLVQFLHGLRE